MCSLYYNNSCSSSVLFLVQNAAYARDGGSRYQYTHDEAAKAMGVGFSTVGKWVKQLRQERDGKQVKQMPMTPEQIEIRELKKTQ